VSILEPFIDTIIICTLTGLVILSSGVWTEKFDNKFEASSMLFVEGQYLESNVKDTETLREYYYGSGSNIELNGTIEVLEGVITSKNITLMHNRSIAENVVISADNVNFTGSIEIINGRIVNINDFVVKGKSLLLGADLTGKAFTKSIFGDFGQYIVAIGLLLFAFSTVIAWSYYGDRATAHLFGEGWILYYRIIYVAAFFTASIIDTKIVWDIATVIGPIATIPNLLALIFLRKEMKQIADGYQIRKDP